MERETKTITTPIGKQEVVIKTYLTGGEKRALTDVYLNSGMKFDVETSNVKDLDLSIVNKAQDVAWETVIVSIAGSSENIIKNILDMRSDDTDFITKSVNEITADPSTEKKTK